MARVGTQKVFALFLAGAALGAVGCNGSRSSAKNASTAAALSLPTARAAHTATFVPQTGEILVAGGLDVTGKPLASTVLITPTSVTPGPDLTTARVGHTATALNNGSVLIAGGSSDAQGLSPLTSTEVYDPITKTFSAGPTLSAPRMKHVAASFINQAGEFVVLAGGAVATQTAQQVQLTPVASAEVIDVTNMTATPMTQSLSRARYDAQLARLDTGNFLIVGGEGAQGADLFSPTAGTFTFVPSVIDRSGSAVASRGHEVLVAGGQSSTGVEDSTEVYDSATNMFTQGVRLGTARRDATATVVGSEVVVIGGRTATGVTTVVERLNGTALGQAAVTQGPALQSGRYAHAAIPLPNTQKVLVIGGFDASGTPLASIEQVDLAATTSTGSGSAGTTTTGTPGSPGTVGTGGTSVPVGSTMPGVSPGVSPGATGSTGSTGSTSGSSSSGSSGGGISGFLSSIFGSGSSGNILTTIVQAALAALTNNQGGGFSGFMQAFVQNLLGSLAGGGGSGGGLGGLLQGLLGGLLGGSGSGTSSGTSSGGGLLSSLLSGLLGGAGGGSSSGSGTSSSSGAGGLLSSLLGGLFGGSGQGATSSGGAGSSGTAPGIVGMTPGQGHVGDSVLISAQNITSSVVVRFNNVPAVIAATNTNGNTTILTVTVPQGATTGTVTVETGGQTLNAGTFTVN